MDGFTMDGYRDLDAIADELWDEGIELGAKNRDQLRCNIAFILQRLLSKVPGQKPMPEQAWEFWAGCGGMVACAEDEEMI